MTHPMQPQYVDEVGTRRFRSNAIIRWLCDLGRINLNEVAVLPGIAPEDRRQLAQLLGYSLSGYSELPYVDDAEWERVQQSNDPAASPVDGVSDPLIQSAYQAFSTLTVAQRGLVLCWFCDACHVAIGPGESHRCEHGSRLWPDAANTERETDWRDAFMAALAGGETSNGAASIADAAVEMLAARRLKVGGPS